MKELKANKGDVGDAEESHVVHVDVEETLSRSWLW